MRYFIDFFFLNNRIIVIQTQIFIFYNLAREYFGRSASIKFYDNETGEDTIHLIPEIPIAFMGTYIVPKSSPFISKFNKVIHISKEAGIIDHAIKSSFYRQNLKKIERYRKGLIKSRKLQVICMEHITDLMCFWAICVLFCIFVFICELNISGLGECKKGIECKTLAF